MPFFHGGVQSLGLLGLLLLIHLTRAPSCFFSTAFAEEFLLVFTCRAEGGVICIGSLDLHLGGDDTRLS